MAKSRQRTALQAKLETCCQDPQSAGTQVALTDLCQCKFGDLVAQAAKLIDQVGLTDLLSVLVAAFDRCLEKPADRDPNCLAKCAIATALYHFTYSNEALFLRGIRHVQMEPVWGGTVDTAPKLRGICALGLVRMHYPDIMVELADLLADPEAEARIGAARAIAYTENSNGLPVLRLRALVGDQPEVVAECLIALLKLDAAGSLTFVSQFLTDPQPQIQELVAFALGESRLEAAFDLLKDWWMGVYDRELRASGLVAIAMLRFDTAINFLIQLVADGPIHDAHLALKALGLYRSNSALWNRLQQIVEERDDVSLRALVYEHSA